jgi:hypothetical protein
MYCLRRIVLCVAVCGFAGRAESADWKTWIEVEDYAAQKGPKAAFYLSDRPVDVRSALPKTGAETSAAESDADLRRRLTCCLG